MGLHCFHTKLMSNSLTQLYGLTWMLGISTNHDISFEAKFHPNKTGWLDPHPPKEMTHEWLKKLVSVAFPLMICTYFWFDFFIYSIYDRWTKEVSTHPAQPTIPMHTRPDRTRPDRNPRSWQNAIVPIYCLWRPKSTHGTHRKKSVSKRPNPKPTRVDLRPRSGRHWDH